MNTRGKERNNMKKCPSCYEIKDLSAFSKDKRQKDGRRVPCKSCVKIYRQSSEYKTAMHNYRTSEKGRKYSVLASNHRKIKYPERIYAKNHIHNLIVSGKLKKETCMMCGKIAEAHHPDYSQPDFILWLCGEHHKIIHGQI